MGQLSQHKGSSSLRPARETKRRREPVPWGPVWLDTQLHPGGMGRRMEPRRAKAASLRLTGWDTGDVLLFCLNFSWHRNPHPAPTHDLRFEKERVHLPEKKHCGGSHFSGQGRPGALELGCGAAALGQMQLLGPVLPGSAGEASGCVERVGRRGACGTCSPQAHQLFRTGLG